MLFITFLFFYYYYYFFWGLGDEIDYNAVAGDEPEVYCQQFRKLILFSGNDYLGLSSHPTVAKAAAKVCLITFNLCFC